MAPVTPSADRSSAAFLRHVAHDLRASLNVVVSWGELLKAGRLSPEETVRAGETIVRHSRQMSQRLGDALDVWRLDLGLLSVAPGSSTVSAAVRAAADAAQPQFESRKVECAVGLHADGVTQADGARLAQALVVLLANALSNTQAGQRVEVTLTLESHHLVVRVVGGGRLPEEAAFRRDPTETGSSGGARPFDFGLSLAKTLIELNGGVLGVEPADPNRVAFVVRVPVAQPQHAPPPSP